MFSRLWKPLVAGAEALVLPRLDDGASVLVTGMNEVTAEGVRTLVTVGDWRVSPGGINRAH